jgi:hypothetical protein
MHDAQGKCDEERASDLITDQISRGKGRVWSKKWRAKNWWHIQKLHVQVQYQHVHVYIT